MLRRRHRAKERTRGRRILFATDVHGSERCFRKFLNAAPLYEIDYLILGGDITGKLMVPIVSRTTSVLPAPAISRASMSRPR